MTKKICDTKAAQSLSAKVVLKDGRYICKILAYHTDMRTTVEVWGPDVEYRGFAGGWGYDRFTAALHKCVIDGHELCDHSSERLPLPECGYFARDFVPPKGYRLANWRTDVNGWNDCYKSSGLDYLYELGYQIIGVL